MSSLSVCSRNEEVSRPKNGPMNRSTAAYRVVEPLPCSIRRLICEEIEDARCVLGGDMAQGMGAYQAKMVVERNLKIDGEQLGIGVDGK